MYEGVYWRQQGKPCDNLGSVKYRIPNGTELSGTAQITRGFKSGYDINQTAGVAGDSNSGKGGTGATGGDGALMVLVEVVEVDILVPLPL